MLRSFSEQQIRFRGLKVSCWSAWYYYAHEWCVACGEHKSALASFFNGLWYYRHPSSFEQRDDVWPVDFEDTLKTFVWKTSNFLPDATDVFQDSESYGLLNDLDTSYPNTFLLYIMSFYWNDRYWNQKFWKHSQRVCGTLVIWQLGYFHATSLRFNAWLESTNILD